MQSAVPSTVTAWSHQQAAYLFVKKLWESGRHGAMLAMVMASGKSKVAIDLANDLSAALILILCPLRVVEVWRQQFLRFSAAPYEFVALDNQIKSVRRKTALARHMLKWSRERGQRLVICINYDSARSDPFASFALSTPWPLVILDESHRIKSASGRTSRFCGQLGLCARYRLALTGTPMPHEPTDIWGQFRFLDPYFLNATYGGFRLHHAVMGGYYGKETVGWKNLDELYAKFSQLAFRVNESVLDLPPEMDETLSTELGREGARLYREMEEDMITWIRTTEAAGIPVTAANAMVRLTRLHQITGGSLPDDRGEPQVIDHAKEQLLADFLEDLDPTEPVVVFSLFKPDLAAIHRASEAQGRRSGELSGDQSRKDDLAAWQRGGKDDPTVLAVQIQAGGEGIDLSRARLAVYYSLGFSLKDYVQSRARIRRPPQQRPCCFYHLEIRGSIDEYILRAVRARRDLIDETLKELKRCPPSPSNHPPTPPKTTSLAGLPA